MSIPLCGLRRSNTDRKTDRSRSRERSSSQDFPGFKDQGSAPQHQPEYKAKTDQNFTCSSCSASLPKGSRETSWNNWVYFCPGGDSGNSLLVKILRTLEFGQWIEGKKAYHGDYGCFLPLCKECIGDLVTKLADKNPAADVDTPFEQVDQCCWRAIVAGHIVQQLRLKYEHAASKQDCQIDDLAEEIALKLNAPGGCKSQSSQSQSSQLDLNEPDQTDLN